jgi:2-(3-amino-3-carboxypropyl)histidine synthase
MPCFGVLMDNITQMIAEIKAHQASRVLIQLPEGLKMRTTEIVKRLEEDGITAYVHNKATYGACDIADADAKKLGCDLVVHVGHSKFYRDFDTLVPVLYFLWIVDVDLSDIDISNLRENRIGLVSSIQHLNMLDDVKKILEAAGKTVVIGGQVLGCWTANAVKIEQNVDAILFVGSGLFHPLGIRSDKNVYSLNLETKKIESVDTMVLEKRRWAGIYKAKDAKSFGILVSTKHGQFNLLGDAQRLKREVEKHHKKAYVLIMDEVRDEEMMGMGVDVFINTACPRLLDNTWTKPVINATDVEKIFESE